MFNSATLIASLIWGSIGLGLAIYGKRQADWAALFGGIALVGVSYFIGSALVMTLVSVALIAGVFWLKRRY